MSLIAWGSRPGWKLWLDDDTTSMFGVNEVLNWSWRLGRLRGIDIRVSWLLGVCMLFEALRFAEGRQWLMIPVGLLMPAMAMAMHALGHVLACRLAGASFTGTTISILNNQDQVSVALRPWSHFLVGFGGPLTNLLLAAACWGGSVATTGLLAAILSYAIGIHLTIGIFNLLACQPSDGHRWWRGLLWAFMPMRKAISATVILGFISAIILLVFAVAFRDFLLLFMGICCLLAMINDRLMISQGQDPVFMVDPNYGGAAPPSAWRRRRAERSAQKAETESTAEQEVLDRLLAKVSENGLPSLTNAERKQLQKISQRQKERSQDE